MKQTGASPYLHTEEAQAVEDWLSDWQPMHHCEANPAWQVEHSFDGALAAGLDIAWLARCGEELDDERLRLRNLCENAIVDVIERNRAARASEDLADRLEVLIADLMLRFPEEGREKTFADQLYGHLHNIAGIRLVAGIIPDSFAEKLFAIFQAGGVPIGFDEASEQFRVFIPQA